jgi:hypothetical protein
VTHTDPLAVVEVAGFTLLRNEADREGVIRLWEMYLRTEPDSYPVFAREDYDYNRVPRIAYLYPADVAAMQKAFAALEEKCETCNGFGVLSAENRQLVTCPRCKGKKP